MAPETGIQASADSESGLFGTSVTLEYVEKKIQEVLNTSAKFGPDVATSQFGYGQGFLSVMVRLKPDWQGEKANELPASFVVKIPSTVTMKAVSKQTNWKKKVEELGSNMVFDAEEHFKAFEVVLKMAHASEVSFYEMVNKDKMKVKVPKCYYTEHYGPNGENGLLIMEDLGDHATIKPIYEGLSVESVKEVLENLAAIHAHSLLHDQWLSNPNMKSTVAKFQKASGDNFKPMMVGAMDLLKKAHPELFDPLMDRLRDRCEKELDLEKMDTIHEQLNIPPVMTHGDLWMNNMMWKKTEDGKSTTDELVAIVDWQLVHPGCIGEDFVRLLCSSVEPNIRREHLDEFMLHYHTSLKTKLGKEPPFTVAQILNGYKHLFRYGVVKILPSFQGFVQAEMGMMGIENVEQRKQNVLNRAKCLLEDLYVLEDELGL